MFLHYCVKPKQFTYFCTTVQTERVHMLLHYCANRSLHVSALLSKLKFTCCCATVQIEGVHMLPHYCANRRNSQMSALLCKPKEFTSVCTTVQTEGVHKCLHYCANRGSSFTCCCTTVQTEGVQFEFSVALRPQKLCGLLVTASPGRPFRLSHTAPEL